MTIGLSYNDDLSRVQIALSSLSEDGTVRVERSTKSGFPSGHTFTVRGGVALPVVSGAATLDDYDGWADSVANFYRVVPVDPPAGLLLTGVADDTASTPDAGALDVANELRLGIDLQLDNYNPGDNSYLLSKYDFSAADQRSYALRIDTTGNLDLLISSNATSFSTAVTAPVPVENGERVAIRGTVSIDDSTGDFTATLESAPTRDGPWTQIATGEGTLSGTALHAGTAPLVVGAASDGTAPAGAGTVFSAWVEDTEVLVADVDFAAQTDGDTSFDDDAGLTWTVNNDAHIVGALLDTDSITPSLDGRVWLKSIWHPFLNAPLNLIDPQETIERASRAGVHEVQGRSTPVASVDLRGSRGFELLARTAAGTAARNMDLTLASGHVFFVHVPAGSIVPGGYVLIGGTGQQRLYRASSTAPVTFRLPCRVVAQPGPDVVGGTMTYGALLNLYGGYNNVLAANPAYAALLDLMATPDDLVVI